MLSYRIKLSTTSKKKNVTNFDKKIKKKLSIRSKKRINTIFSDISTFIEINKVLIEVIWVK